MNKEFQKLLFKAKEACPEASDDLIRDTIIEYLLKAEMTKQQMRERTAAAMAKFDQKNIKKIPAGEKTGKKPPSERQLQAADNEKKKTIGGTKTIHDDGSHSYTRGPHDHSGTFEY